MSEQERMSEHNNWLKYFITEEIVLQDLPASSQELEVVSLPEDIENRTLLVLFRDTGEKAISNKNNLFLQKVLRAVNLSEADFVAVPLPGQWRDLPDKIYRSGPGKVLLFDPSMKPEGLTGSLYTLQNTGQVQWLLADRLEEISDNVAKKKALWKALKSMFNLGKN